MLVVWLNIIKQDLLDEIPEARAIIGTGDIHRVVEVITSIAQDKQIRINAVSDKPTYITEDLLPRLSTNLGPFAYLKIAEGCNHTCSFCIIPQLRGKFRSRSIESLVAETKSAGDKWSKRNHSSLSGYNILWFGHLSTPSSA